MTSELEDGLLLEVCPLCGQTNGDLAGLLLHCLLWHQREEAVGGLRLAAQRYSWRQRRGEIHHYTVTCWCGAKCQFPASFVLSKDEVGWLEHMREAGGLTAHLLQLAMRLPGAINYDDIPRLS